MIASVSKRAAVLFARRDSIYKSLPYLDVYDVDRDALTYNGDLPVIAHPPCRAWGRLRHLANPAPGEKDLALFAVDQVRMCGGVLEHPASSTLWSTAGLPLPSNRGFSFDSYGGWTFPIAQSWLGHKAQKMTWLYIVGVLPSDIPDFPLGLGTGITIVKRMSRADREHTPLPFAQFLVSLSMLSRPDRLRRSPAGQDGTVGALYVPVTRKVRANFVAKRA